ncbi:DUF241 domain protein [Senna tora]|uniref:DUF241 domain protein n=1 Tax=Senna tora TaxID=362788 RepID=A0A834SSM6_9FABA|nr:DUF241 domain protein [Senna tora]
MATTKNQVHRSISLPSRPHPTTIELHQQLHKLKTWESTSSSSSSSHSICTSLSMLDDLYTSLDDLLHMSSTQQAISHHQNEPCVEELLEASLRVLDICGITKDTLLLQIKENVRSLHSALRRRKQDSCVERSVGSSVEKMKIVHGRLEDLEMAIESIENGLESVFRRLIKTRASLLNIISL